VPTWREGGARATQLELIGFAGSDPRHPDHVTRTDDAGKADDPGSLRRHGPGATCNTGRQGPGHEQAQRHGDESSHKGPENQ